MKFESCSCLCIWQNLVILGVGSKIVIVGSETTCIKTHRSDIYALASFTCPLVSFASAGQDKQVILWKISGKDVNAVLKYSHSDSILALSVNPISNSLCSAACSDFGIWSLETKTVVKLEIESKSTCCSWSLNGQFLAIGTTSGRVFIYTKGELSVVLTRSAPVYAIQWCLNSEYLCSRQNIPLFQVLAVTDWSRTLEFFTHTGSSVGRPVSIHEVGDALVIQQTNNLMVICGSSGVPVLYTGEGNYIKTLTKFESMDKPWVWACGVLDLTVFWATSDGRFGSEQIQINNVFAFFRSTYAFRETFTDVVVCTPSKSCRIKVRRVIQAISLSKYNLAVKIKDNVLVFEQKDTFSLRYSVPIMNEGLMCVSSNNLIVSQDNQVLMYDFFGKIVRKWILDSNVTFLKINSGPSSSEMAMIGCENGYCALVFLEFPFIQNLVKQSFSINCIDLSPCKTLMCVVDSSKTLSLYNIKGLFCQTTPVLLSQDPNIHYACWNSVHEQIIAVSGDNGTGIKAVGFPIFFQQMQGTVFGFYRSKMYVLDNKCVTVEGPFTHCVHQFISKKQWKDAFCACSLSEQSNEVWRHLAVSALSDSKENIFLSRTCLEKINDYSLCYAIPELMSDSAALGAKLLAATGKINECFEMLSLQIAAAVEVAVDLGLFDKAVELASSKSMDTATILSEKAKNLEQMGDFRNAAETYLSIGDADKALKLYMDNGEHDRIGSIVEANLQKLSTSTLESVKVVFQRVKQWDNLALVMKLTKDEKSLVGLYIQMNKFNEAFECADEELQKLIYKPYADYLAKNGNFDKALLFYEKANEHDLKVSLLHNMLDSLLTQQLYLAASKISFKLSQEHEIYSGLADYLYAYHYIFCYLEEPFTPLSQSSLFLMARFLLTFEKYNVFENHLSKVAVRLAFLRLGQQLGYNVSQVSNQLSKFRIPMPWQKAFTVHALFNSGSKLQDYNCVYCSTPSEMLDSRCRKCGVMFVFSFHKFENLGLIQFQVDDSLSRECLNPMHLLVFSKEFSPFVISNQDLLKLPQENIFKGKKMYYNPNPEKIIIECKSCTRLFNGDDYEYLQVINGQCPLCSE